MTVQTDPRQPVDFELQTAKSSVPNCQILQKYGRADNVDDALTDIWDGSSGSIIWKAPTSAQTINFVSTSASDNGNDVADTGGATFRAYGLPDWDTAEVSPSTTLNGTTNVPSASQFVIIHRLRMLSWGVGGPNIGDIKAIAETDNTITAMILADPGGDGNNAGQSQMAIYGVPSTHTFYMTQYYASFNKAGVGSADIYLEVNPIPNVVTTGFITKHMQSINSTGTSRFRHPFHPYYPIPGPAIVKIQGRGSGPNLDVSAGFDGYVVMNG